MISEIRGKLNFASEISKSEDKLTGSFFGALRYLPYRKGLLHVLREAKIYQGKKWEYGGPSYLDLLEDHSEEFIGDKIEFWRMTEDGELDLEIDLDSLFIGVEVKYLSGLSSEDQLERELRIIDKKRGSKSGFLIFLAPASMIGKGIRAVERISNPNILEKVGFAYISWESVYELLLNLAQDYNPYEEQILADILEILRLRGFEKFKSFELKKELEVVSYHYEFSYNYRLRLNYDFMDQEYLYLSGGDYYEFR